MPDFEKIAQNIRNRKQQLEENVVNTNEPVAKKEQNVYEDINERYQQAFGPKAKEQDKKPSLDFSATEWKNEGLTADQAGVRENIAETKFGGDQSQVQMNEMYVDPNSLGVNAVYQNLLEKSADNLMVGTGNLIGGLGNTLDGILIMTGMDEMAGNPISEALRDSGNSLSESFKTYVPEDILNPQFKLSTFMNPEFWAVHGAQFVPQLVEILLTKKASGAAVRGTSKIGRKVVGEVVEETAEGAFKKSLTATTKGARGTNEVAGTGKGLLGKMFRDTGELTRLGENVMGIAYGGALTNLKVSLQNSGEIYNTFKDIKDENGENFFSKEELGQMASSAFTNNMQYMGVDMLSWGMTFGNGWSKIGSMASKTLSPAVQRKTIGALFAKASSPMLNKIAKFSGKAIAEGFEETIQESWEEWSKYKAYKKYAGTSKGYPGMNENHDSFWDYYTSKDSEALRAISFGLGMGAGGVFNMKTLVDNQAEQMFQLQDRIENLSTKFEKGSQGRQMQDFHIKQQMAELVFNNKEEAFSDFIGHLEEKGTLSAEQVDAYSETFNQMKAAKEDIADLSIVGKSAYMNNIAGEMDIVGKIEIETNKHNKNITLLKEQLKDDPDGLAKAIKKQETVYKQQMGILGNLLSGFQQNKKNILKGEPATKVDFDTTYDENGNEVYKEPTSEKSEEVQKEEESFGPPSMKKSMFDKISQQGKAALESIGLGNLFGEENNAKEEIIIDNDLTKDGTEAIVKQEAPNVSELENSLVELQAKENEFKANRTEELRAEGKTDDEVFASISNEWQESEDGKMQSDIKYKIEDFKKNPQNYSNPKLTQNDSKTLLDNEAYKEFVDNGTATTGVINAIANDISNGKELTKEQQAVREAFSTEIEEILNEKLKVQKEAEKDVEKGFDMNDSEQAAQANYQKRALNRKPKKKSLKDINEEAKAKLAENKINRKDNPDNDDEAFQGRAKKPIASVFGEAVSKAKGLIGNIKGSLFVDGMTYAEMKEDNENKKLKGSINLKSNNLYQYEIDALRLSQTWAINEKLALMFPDADIHVTAAEDLSNAVGMDVMGYTLSGAIYIDNNSWNQDDVFMHEMSHIYYDFMKNDPNTSVIVNNVLRDKNLIDIIKRNYADDVLYKNKKGDVANLRKIRKLYSNNVSDNEEDFKLDFGMALSNGDFVELPLEEQEVIKEEAFAFYLEGPLSKQYDKFFNPKDERVRQFLVKKWWGKIKSKAENATKEYTSNEKIFLEGLSDAKVKDFNSSKEFIMTQFTKSIIGNNIDLSASGKAKAIENYQDLITEQNADIESRYAVQSKNIGLKPEKEIIDIVDIADNLDSDINSENFFEVNRLKYVQKASQYISLFTKNYNQVLRRKYYNKYKDSAVNWKNIELFDKDMLMIKLMQIAKESYSNIDFIRRIENSDVQEIAEFNDFLEQIRPDDKLVVLSSMKFIYGNQSNINSVIGFVDENGNYQLQNNLNNKEVAQAEYVYSKFNSAAFNYFNSLNPNNTFPVSESMLGSYTKLIESIENIKSKTYSEQDLYNFLSFFSTPDMDIMSILKENRINVNGKNFTVDTVVNEVIKKNFTLGKNPYGVYDNDQKGQYKTVVRKFVQSLIATNRKFTAEYTVKNANEKQEPIRVVDNMLTRQLDKMNIDATKMSKKDFIKKYASVTNSGKGSQSNPILNYVYDRVQAGEKIDLNQFHGIKNQQTKNSSVIAESNSVEQSIFESLSFMAETQTSYMMETGRYSDSPTSYMLRVPKIDLKNLGKFSNGKFVFNTNSKSILDNTFSTFSKLQGGNLTYAEFVESIRTEIEKEIEFTNENNNAFLKIQNAKKYFGKEGKLNDDGKNKIAEYVINQIVNGVAYNDIFFPSFKLDDIVKRQKSGRSPGFRLGKGVQIEPIYYVDDFVNGQSVSDSSMYVLREDAELLKKAGGDMMPLNNSYKILMTGVEYDNPNFANKNLFDKGYATILDDEIVAKNPRLKGLYELMKTRRQNYVDKVGPIQNDLLNGISTHLMYAAPVSSIKSGNTPFALTEKVDGIEMATEKGQPFTLDALNELDFTEQNKILDNWHYDEQGFVGLSSQNFVVQQVMDKESYSSNTPVQMTRAILTNGSVEGSLALAEEIQSLIVAQQQEVLSKYKSAITSENPIIIREFIISQMAMNDVDATQRLLIIEDLLSMSTPALRELAKNTMSNAIRINGNKLKTPGGIAQAKAATYEKPYKVNGSKQLEFYGTKEIEKDGKLVTIHTKGEAVLPLFMDKNNPNNKNGKIVARQYFVQDAKSKENKPIDLLEKLAKQEAKRRGVDYKEIYNDRGVLIGFYAEGDTIIATRIPSHGPQTTGVFEVIDFDSSGASNIQLPSEFALDITGGDFDGDQFFIQHKGGKKFEKWNNAFDKLTDLWLSEKMFGEVRLPIDFKEEAEAAVKEINSAYGKHEKSNFHFSPAGKRIAYNNTLVSKKNIGVSANLHSLIGMLSAYETDLLKPISINGVTVNKFHDVKGESRTINSAKILNLILDNAKNQFADTLGINEHTISSAMILRNLGYSLTDIGLIMNSKAVLEMNKLLSNNENVFKDKKSISDLEKIVRSKLGAKTQSVSLNTKDLSNSENVNAQHAVLDLMVNLGTINEEIMNISGIMQGHNKLENNPFILNEQKNKFVNTILNENNKGIKVPFALTQNPLVQNYLDVFDFNMETMRTMDPVYNKTGIAIFEKITEGVVRNLSDNEIRKIHNDIEMSLTARSLGLNNVDEDYMKSLIEPKNPQNIFDRMSAYMESQKAIIVKLDKTNVRNSINAMENNMLLTRGLRYSLKGNTTFISLNSNFFNENLSEVERDRMIDEFNALPMELKNDLLIYDMFTHGLKGPQSMFHVMDKTFKQNVSAASQIEQNLSTRGQIKELTKRLVQTNSSIFREYKGKVYDESGALNPDFIKNNPAVISNIVKGKETIVKFIDDSNKPKIFHFYGWNNEQIAQIKSINPKDVPQFVSENIMKSERAVVYDANVYNNGIGVIALKDNSTGAPIKLDRKSTINDIDVNVEDDFVGRSRKQIASDYYNYTHTLSQEQLMDTLNVNRNNVDQAKQNNIYSDYLANKNKADEISKTINSDSVKKMSDEKLIELYSGKKLNDGEPGYGHRDKIAYASVIRPIILEIANRAGVEQAKMAKENSGKDISYTGKDMGFLESYLISNNIPSGQPEIQALVRKMEIEYKKFQNEKNKMLKDLNKATDELYKEQFGSAPSNLITKFIKSLKDALFQNKEDMYMKLYGPLLEFQEITNSNGRKITNMKYKTQAQIESGFENGNISQAQYNFYKASRDITEKLKPFALGNEQAGREDYIPHTAPAWLEIKSRRGMLGLAVNAKTVDERIYDVRMKFTNPLTNKVEDNASFHHIENVYNILSKQKAGNNHAKDFILLKKKAIVLARKLKNEDGSDLRLSEVEAGSAIGDVFMDRFTSSRSISATDLPSLDLNKAFMDYTHSVLFNHGNENFMGMNKQLPLVEGILALADSRKDTNSKRYVEKIWKDYFLGGNKQDSKFGNSATLEAVGITTDKVIDYLTKGSLIYWLGFNGLLIGGGAYAIGNVLIGKYMTIKNNGGVEWAEGEKRFWNGYSGFSVVNPFRGIKESSEILKNLGFMDINVYDNVSMEDKSSLEKSFMNVALMPMIYSEKWIQGVDFLGRLKEDEWNTLKNGGTLSEARMTELENEVKINHGKGYQATDQRMVQMYSWGRNMLQFSRYIPTLFYDQFAKDDVNIYGKQHIGSYRAVGKYIQKVVRGEISASEFFKYRDSLSEYEKKRFNQGLIGFGMLAVFQGLHMAGNESAQGGFFADANPLLDSDKMLDKVSSTPTINMFDKVLN